MSDGRVANWMYSRLRSPYFLNQTKQNMLKIEVPYDTPIDITKSIGDGLLDRFESLEIVSFHKSESEQQMYLVILDDLPQELSNNIKKFLHEQLRFFMFHFN